MHTLRPWANFIALALLISSTICQAQVSFKAQKAFNQGKFDKAISLFQKSLEGKDSTREEYHILAYRLAESYRMQGDYASAERIHSSLNYQFVSRWGYAITLMQQYRTDKAMRFVRKELKHDPFDVELLSIQRACELNLMKIDEKKVLVTPVSLDKKQNHYAECPGILIGQYNFKHITPQEHSRLPGRSKGKSASKGMYPMEVAHIKTKENGDYVFQSPDKLFYTLARNHFDYFLGERFYDLSKALLYRYTIYDPAKPYTEPNGKTHAEWTEESSFYDSKKEIVKQGCLSPDGSILIFSTNELKGEGGYDLFACLKRENGWSKPINLGERINSTYNEFYPFISANNILYYSSNGKPGHGGYDIYSFPLEHLDSIEVQPENLPRPYNSPYDDYAFIYHETTGYGFFSSTRPGGIFSNTFFQFQNKIINCDAQEAFAELKNKTPQRCDQPAYCVTLDYSHLRDSSGKYSYMLSTGDGRKEKGLKFNHCYEKPGTYKLKLYKIDIKTRRVDTLGIIFKDLVVEEKDHLNYTFTLDEVDPLEVAFSTAGTVCRKCEEVSYFWDFGDGTYGCGPDVRHKYRQSGNYQVRVLVTYRKAKEDRQFYCSGVLRL